MLERLEKEDCAVAIKRYFTLTYPFHNVCRELGCHKFECDSLGEDKLAMIVEMSDSSLKLEGHFQTFCSAVSFFFSGQSCFRFYGKRLL